jgi:taurine dioxygenase
MPTPQSRTEQRPAFRTRPLHPALGVEVTSIDARAAGNGTIEELQALLVEHQLLVLREQELDPSALVEFARRFGEPEIFPAEFAYPDSRSVLQISNRSERPSAAYWHTDGARQPEPPSLTLLYAEQVPDEGGDTLFLNTYAAYEALDAEDKETLGGLRALLGTGVEHPIVRTHPVTGRRALYVDMGYTTGVKGSSARKRCGCFGSSTTTTATRSGSTVTDTARAIWRSGTTPASPTARRRHLIRRSTCG